MEYAETLKWTGVYLGLWLLAGVIGGAIVAVGFALGGLAALGAYQLTPFALRVAFYPTAGIAVVALGLLAFKVGAAAALVHVVVSATESRLSAALDTETLKSDILSVLDERLSEMHGELSETKGLVEETTRSSNDGIEFE